MNLANLRRWSVVAVVANVGIALLAAAVLPAHALGLLPVLALTLPLLTTGVLDAAASGCARQN
jgi:predicted anti-sigma-YlaC factor YlaD